MNQIDKFIYNQNAVPSYLKKFLIWITLMFSGGAFAQAWAFEIPPEAPKGQCRRVTELEFRGEERILRVFGNKVEEKAGQCGIMLLVNDGVWIVTETPKECECIMFWYRTKHGIR